MEVLMEEFLILIGVSVAYLVCMIAYDRLYKKKVKE